MPFPGQFAFDPMPRVMERSDEQTNSSSSVSNEKSSAGISTTGKGTAPVNTTSSAAFTNPFVNPPLILVAQLGDLATLNRLLTQGGIDINQVDELNGSSALMAAAAMGHVEVVKMLVRQEGIKLDQTNSRGDSALHLATTFNNPDVVACLLDAGADVNLEIQKPVTPH